MKVYDYHPGLVEVIIKRMQRSAGKACVQSLIHVHLHNVIHSLRQHRVINDVGEVLFHQLVLVTTCYWLTNNGQVSIHNVHTIVINQQYYHTCVSMYQLLTHLAVNTIKR